MRPGRRRFPTSSSCCMMDGATTYVTRISQPPLMGCRFLIDGCDWSRRLAHSLRVQEQSEGHETSAAWMPDSAKLADG